MFFFFKQKTAYEMLRSLVGSEMCIRDRRKNAFLARRLDRLDSCDLAAVRAALPVLEHLLDDDR